MAKNIEMNYKGDGGYEVVYPLTLIENVLNWNSLIYGKKEVVSDSTINSYGLSADSTPDTVFKDILGRLSMIANNWGRVKLTVTDTDSLPVPNTLVTGLLNEAGEDGVVTDSLGIAVGYAKAGSATVRIQGFADLVNTSTTFQVQAGVSYEQALTNVEYRSFLKLTSSSANYKISGKTKRVDVTLVGGGGGGSGAIINYSGSGGGGGYCIVQENASFVPNMVYSAQVGAGGKGGKGTNKYDPVSNSHGGNGGTTSFLNITASGGNGGQAGRGTAGGIGNGNGGRGQGNNSGRSNGTDGAVLGYSTETQSVRYGGGGGGGEVESYYPTYPGYGGNDFGADGGNNAQANTGGGGGGGYCDNSGDRYGGGGNGGSGVIVIKMYKS